MVKNRWFLLLLLVFALSSCQKNEAETEPKPPVSSMAAPTPTLEPIRAPEPPFYLSDGEWNSVKGVLLVEFLEFDQIQLQVSGAEADDQTSELDGAAEIEGTMILAGGVVKGFKALQEAITESASGVASHICNRHVRENPRPTASRDEYDANSLLATLDRIRLGQFYLVKAAISKSGQLVALLKIGGEHWIFFIASKLNNHTDSLFRPAGDLKDYTNQVFSGYRPVNRRQYLPIIRFAAGCYRKSVQQKLEANKLTLVDPSTIQPELQVLWPGAIAATTYVAGTAVSQPTIASQYDAVPIYDSNSTYIARMPALIDGKITYFEYEAQKIDGLTGTEILLLATVGPVVVYVVGGFVVTAAAGAATVGYATASQALAAGASLTPILVPLATAP